jgi:hypothetical protein
MKDDAAGARRLHLLPAQCPFRGSHERQKVVDFTPRASPHQSGGTALKFLAGALVPLAAVLHEP